MAVHLHFLLSLSCYCCCLRLSPTLYLKALSCGAERVEGFFFFSFTSQFIHNNWNLANAKNIYKVSYIIYKLNASHTHMKSERNISI
jgi:hypothetical protein